jgi:hypothetical protein
MDAAKFNALFPKSAPNAGFDAWMAKVDAIITKKCGLTSRHLPDWMYFDAYDDGASPASAAKAAIKAAKE